MGITYYPRYKYVFKPYLIYVFCQRNLPKIYNRKILIKRIYHAILISDFLNLIFGFLLLNMNVL